MRQRALAAMSASGRAYWESESGYFESITGISGVLKKYEKDERKARVVEELAKVPAPDPDLPRPLYVPTNPDCKVGDGVVGLRSVGFIGFRAL